MIMDWHNYLIAKIIMSPIWSRLPVQSTDVTIIEHYHFIKSAKLQQSNL